MTTGRCEHCLRQAELSAAYGERLCGNCLWTDHLDRVRTNGLTVREDGVLRTYRTHDENGIPFILPRRRA